MAGSSSGSTSSTRSGFTSFEELCKGTVKKYSHNLVDLRKKTTRERIDALIDKIEETINSLQQQTDKTIQHFCIGKTYVEAKSGTTFNPNNVATWRVQGISSRWHQAYKNKGYDGLVVLGAVSRGMLSDKRNKKVWKQQLYILFLESALITHFAYDDCDKRLGNYSLQPGQLQKKLSAGYVVYMAFKYEDPEETGESDESSDHALVERV